MATAGLPESELSVSSFWAPSSTRATSLILRFEPSGLARNTISPNCSAVVRRPSVCRFIWNCWSGGTGSAPIRPIAAWLFCAWMALVMSEGARLSAVSRCVSNQMRIE